MDKDKDKVSGQGQGQGQGKLNQRKDFESVRIERTQIDEIHAKVMV